MIEIKELTKNFGGTKALDHVSFVYRTVLFLGWWVQTEQARARC